MNRELNQEDDAVVRNIMDLRVAPVWVLTWILKLLGRLKRFEQVGQTCLLPLSAPSPADGSSPSSDISSEESGCEDLSRPVMRLFACAGVMIGEEDEERGNDIIDA